MRIKKKGVESLPPKNDQKKKTAPAYKCCTSLELRGPQGLGSKRIKEKAVLCKKLLAKNRHFCFKYYL
jgi:hypothetical protein